MKFKKKKEADPEIDDKFPKKQFAFHISEMNN